MPAAARAQIQSAEWPNRVVRLIVPVTAGDRQTSSRAFSRKSYDHSPAVRTEEHGAQRSLLKK
jgi:hypothetical protein